METRVDLVHRQPRAGWDALFQVAKDEQDDLLLEGLLPNDFDRGGWDW
jgi:hypothetical protein